MKKSITEKRFTEEMVIRILNEKELTLNDIQKELKAGRSTTINLLGSLLKENMIKKKNAGVEKRPLYLYSTIK